jgi:hypothetical protein
MMEGRLEERKKVHWWADAGEEGEDERDGLEDS